MLNIAKNQVTASLNVCFHLIIDRDLKKKMMRWMMMMTPLRKWKMKLMSMKALALLMWSLLKER